MQTNTVKAAIAAAEHFIATANKTRPAKHWNPENRAIFPYQESGKDTAACKRASMELTRALADLRADR